MSQRARSQRAQIGLLPDGRRLHLHDGPIDVIVEAFGDAHKLAGFSSNRCRSNVYRYPVSSLVAEKHQRRTAVYHIVAGSNLRAGHAAQNAVLLVALGQDVFTAGSSDHIVTAVAGDSLRSFVPEQNFPVTTHQANAGVQAFQDRTEDMRILKFRHTENECFLSKLPSALHQETAGG